MLAAASEGGGKVVLRLSDLGAVPRLRKALSEAEATQDLVCHVSLAGLTMWEAAILGQF